jgi:ParB/RepB/Spo0J family partition protein
MGFPFSPRLQLDVVYIHQLALSIDKFGLRESIIVRQHPSMPEKYQGVSGENLVQALLSLNQTRTTVTLMALDDFQARIIALHSNLEGTSRKAVKPIEIAFAIKGLVDLGHSMTEIGEGLGKSKQWVSKMNKLSKVHPEIYAEMSTRVDSPYMWAELVKLEPDEQITLRNNIKNNPEPVPVRLINRLVTVALESDTDIRAKLLAMPLDKVDGYLTEMEDEKLRGNMRGKTDFDCPYKHCKLHFTLNFEAKTLSWLAKAKSKAKVQQLLEA